MYARQKEAALQILKQRGELSARDLRSLMRDEGVKMRLAPFFFMMSELHETRQVERRIETYEIEGVEIERLHYKSIQTGESDE